MGKFSLKRLTFCLLNVDLGACGSLLREPGLLSIYVCGLLFFAVCRPLTVVAYPVAEHRLWTRRPSGHGSRTQLLRSMWDPPGPGHEPLSPASAGGLSTIASPGESLSVFLMIVILVGEEVSFCSNLHFPND